MLHWLLMAAFVPAPERLSAPISGDEITGGELVAAGEFDEVVAIHVGSAVVCSGTRIAPGLVLTAAHCLTDTRVSDLSISAGLDALTAPRQPAIAFGVHPDFCRECDEDVFDYGFVRVVPGSLGIDALAVPIVDQAEWDEAFGRGTEVTIVGYGADPATGSPARTKRKVTVAVTDTSASGQEFAAGGEFRDSCDGDSGGPVFVELSGGRRRQVGITSRGSMPCGRGGFYATPYPALGWLREQTGVDLCGPACATCDCLDITPPPPERGCGCTAPRSKAPGLLAMMLLAGGCALRRRRPRQSGGGVGIGR